VRRVLGDARSRGGSRACLRAPTRVSACSSKRGSMASAPMGTFRILTTPLLCILSVTGVLRSPSAVRYARGGGGDGRQGRDGGGAALATVDGGGSTSSTGGALGVGWEPRQLRAE